MMLRLGENFKRIITSSSELIVRSESDGPRSRLAGSEANLDVTRSQTAATEEAVIKTANVSIMDLAKPTAVKDIDYVVDVILPTLLIALLFVGNAVIVYIIFQYRKSKRNVNDNFRELRDGMPMSTIRGNP